MESGWSSTLIRKDYLRRCVRAGEYAAKDALP